MTPNKTDKNDARGIAQVVRTGWVRPVHMKSRDSHYIRTMLTSRKAVLYKCIDLENEIRYTGRNQNVKRRIT